MEFSMTHMLILLVIALLVFGARRIPDRLIVRARHPRVQEEPAGGRRRNR